MNEIATTLLSAAIGGLIGGGALAGLVWQAMENRLRGTFATREGLQGRDGERLWASRADVQAIGDMVRDRATREDLAAMRSYVDGRLDRKRRDLDTQSSLIVSMDDRLGVVETRVERLDERQTQQWSRISDQMAATARMNESTAQRLEQMGSQLQDLALRMERIQRSGN